MTQLCLPHEIWLQISTDNPMVYYKLVQTSKVFKLDTDTMKAKFIKQVISSYGSICSVLPNGDLHSIDDKPAIIERIGNQYWYVDGKSHRDGDKPATIDANGDQFWYKHGKLHRDNSQPAVIWADGEKFYYTDGVLCDW